MKKILVTGFDPFGGEKINPALVAVKQLPNDIDGVQIVKKEIPTVFNKSIEILYKALKEEQPDAVICVGQAGGRSTISVERVAINQDDALIPDNEGTQPIDRMIIPDGPAAYFSTLPIKAMVRDMKASKIPASISNTAGTFVCNHLMYAALHYAALNQSTLKAGFVHIPYLPMQVVDKPNMPSMSCADIVKGLTALIQTTIHVQDDITELGGSIN